MTIKSIFKKLKIKKNDFVILHGSYNSSIIYNSKEPKKKLLNELVNFFKKDGSLFVPAFTAYKFKKKKINYSTESDLGDFSNDFLNLKDIKRTKHPIFSFAYFPNKKTEKLVKKLSLNTCFGKNSLFDLSYKKNGKIICLGNGFKHISFTIFVEQKKRVSYRYEKIFKVNYEGKNKNVSYFVRKLNIRSDLNYSLIKKKIIKNKDLKFYEKKRILFYSFEAKKYFKACSQVLKKNHYGLIDEGIN